MSKWVKLPIDPTRVAGSVSPLHKDAIPTTYICPYCGYTLNTKNEHLWWYCPSCGEEMLDKDDRKE